MPVSCLEAARATVMRAAYTQSIVDVFRLARDLNTKFPEVSEGDFAKVISGLVALTSAAVAIWDKLPDALNASKPPHA